MFKYDLQILVADDATGMRKFFIKVLKEIGFKNFHEAQDGAHAWEILNDLKVPIDVVFLDINMPNMNGLEVLDKIKGDPNLKDLPVIMVTAEEEMKTTMSALKKGAATYIIKHLETKEIIAKLSNVKELLNN